MGAYQSKCVLFIDFDEAPTLTGSTEASGLPVENLQVQALGTKWRTTSDSAQTLVIDFGAAQYCDCVVAAGHNLTAAGTIKVEYSATGTFSGEQTEALAATTAITNPFSATDWDDRGWANGSALTNVDVSEFLPPVYFGFTGASARYWRITIDDAANPDGYVEFGRLAVAAAWSPPSTFSWGSTHQILDPSEVEHTIGQNPLSVQRLSTDIYQWTWQRINRLQFANYFEPLAKILGTGLDALWCPDEQSGRGAWTDRARLYGRLVEMPTYTEQLVGGSLSFRLRRSK